MKYLMCFLTIGIAAFAQVEETPKGSESLNASPTSIAVPVPCVLKVLKEEKNGLSLIQYFYPDTSPYTSPFLSRNTSIKTLRCGPEFDRPLVAEGPFVMWDKNGQKTYQGHYKNGKEDGFVMTWTNGQKSFEVTFKNGKPEGRVIYWFDDTHKDAEEHYKNGHPEGIGTKWHFNGQKAAQARYKEGKIDQDWMYWDAAGKETDTPQ